MQIIIQPITDLRLGDVIIEHLTNGEFKRFQAAIAFVKHSGVKHLSRALQNFVANGGKVRIVAGLDHHGTSYEGLLDLLNVVGEAIWVYHADEGASRYYTFHPKIYLFESESEALLLVGSGNLTEGGLYTNDEAIVSLTLSQEDTTLQVVKNAFEEWCDTTSDISKQLTQTVLDELLEADYVRKESASWQATPDEETSEVEHLKPTPTKPKTSMFGRSKRRTAPKVPSSQSIPKPPPLPIPKPTILQPEPIADWFALSVIRRDLPLPNSSPEISVTKGIRDKNPLFWGWQDNFIGPDERGQYVRSLRIEFEGYVIDAYLQDYPGHKPDGMKASADFRLGAISPIVRSLENEDDVVVLERIADEAIDYKAHVILAADLARYPHINDNLIEYKRSRSRSGTVKKYYYG